MHMKRALCCMFAILMAATACTDAPAPDDSSTAPAAEAEWTDLLSQNSLAAWRGYKRDTPPSGWSVSNGVLTFTPGEDGGDLMTRAQYESFELMVDFKLSPGGNSGIIYRVTEENDASWHSGPEYQLIDDDGYPDELQPAQRTASNYDLQPPAEQALRPIGEWNTARLVVRGNDVEHWLNDVQVVAYTLGSPEWIARRDASKFIDYPSFGQASTGHVVLQDHGNPIWFRNVKVRSL